MFGLVPRNLRFFDLFDEEAALLIRAAETYVKLTQDYPQRDQHVAAIRQLEHQADDIAHRTFEWLDSTFITPLDREDIHTLVKRMDDVVDMIDAAAKRLVLYKMAQPTPWLIKQTDVLLRACRLVAVVVRKLRHLKKPNGLRDDLKEIHTLENAGDDINHAAVAELYDTASDPIMAMKWKEIYDLTERSIDRCEDIANVAEAIVLKNA